MSVREYIGSRYVPIIADPIEWDSNTAYEPLTIVTNGGNSYTSRQYVPAGISIDDNDYWALTGNYNAQIEQYRQEVRAYDSRITANADAIEDLGDIIPASDFSSTSTVKDAIEAEATARAAEDTVLRNLINIMTPEYLDKNLSVKSLNGDGALRLIRFGTHIVLIDCGNATQAVGAFLAENIGSEDHVDMLVISHMHIDHVTGYQSVIPYVDDETVVVMQMAPTSSNGQYSTYQSYLAQLLEAFPNIFTPSEGQAWTFGDLSVRVNNVTLDDRALYDATPANAGGESGLNNYSLITTVTCPFGSYVDTADIEGVAQEMNADRMTNADVCLLPHHRVNNNGYLPFFKKINPQMFTCVTRSTTGNETTPNAMRHWNGKVMKYLGLDCLCDDIGISEFTLSLRGISTISGSLIPSGIAYQRFRPDLYLAVNAAYYDRNPMSLAEITLRDFCNLYGSLGDVLDIDPNEYLVGTSTFMTQVRTDLRNLINATSTENIRIQVFGGYMDAFVNKIDDNKRARITYSEYYTNPNTGYKIMDARSHRLISEQSTAAASYTVPTADLDIAYDNDVIYAHLESGGFVPMHPYNSTRTIWVGCAFTGSFNLYVARMNAGVLTAAQIASIGSGTSVNVYGIRCVL